jgi:hypothetical protein
MWETSIVCFSLYHSIIRGRESPNCAANKSIAAAQKTKKETLKKEKKRKEKNSLNITILAVTEH